MRHIIEHGLCRADETEESAKEREREERWGRDIEGFLVFGGRQCIEGGAHSGTWWCGGAM